MITKIISGGQTGVDIAGLRAAKRLGIATGGTMPKGFRTLDGNKPEYSQLYGMVEHRSFDYPSRTECNVKMSDVTVRIAKYFDSPGERCTLRFIDKHKKPHVDILLNTFNLDFTNSKVLCKVVDWFSDSYNIVNIAGNSEITCRGIEEYSEELLHYLFSRINCR